MKHADLISVIAAVISAIALVSSIKSCQVSERAFQMSMLEFQGGRSLVLHGEIQEDNVSVKLSPQDQFFSLQQVHYRFPLSLGGDERPALAPDFQLHLSTEIFLLKREIMRRFPHKKDAVTLGLEARMPFLVEAFATVKGDIISDRSIYTLNFKFLVPGEPDKEPEITLLGISFFGRLTADQDSEQELERMWSEASK
jgi:hypothetical protein